MLTDYFKKIVLITLKGAEQRAEKVIKKMIDQGLIASPSDVVIHLGINGNELPPSSWFRAGGGAWGCLMSHVRVLQDAWQDGVENVLVLEDDVCWVDNTLEFLKESWAVLPESWGQLYLGGQHRGIPEIVNDYWMVGKSINRTHAYAVSRETIPQVLQHVLYAPDYIGKKYAPHIDHQLEVAHRRGDWVVVTPKYWLAGQDENDSQINGRHHPTKWWDWCDIDTPVLPFVYSMGNMDKKFTDLIHRGWSEDTRKKLKPVNHSSVIQRELMTIYREAYECRSLPFICIEDFEHLAKIKGMWAPGLIDQSSIDRGGILDLLKPENFKYGQT